MTDTTILGKRKTRCPVCRVPVVGGIHIQRCKPGTEAELDRVLRAGAHGAHEEDLPEPARFLPPVDDLAVARLLAALENGVRVEPGGPAGWRASSAAVREPGTRRLGEIVREAIRVGLVRMSEVYENGTWAIQVVPAPVHALGSAGPVCGDRSVLRYRVLGRELIRLVDCERCMDVPLSGVAYSTYE